MTDTLVPSITAFRGDRTYYRDRWEGYQSDIDRDSTGRANRGFLAGAHDLPPLTHRGAVGAAVLMLESGLGEDEFAASVADKFSTLFHDDGWRSYHVAQTHLRITGPMPQGSDDPLTKAFTAARRPVKKERLVVSQVRSRLISALLELGEMQSADAAAQLTLAQPWEATYVQNRGRRRPRVTPLSLATPLDDGALRRIAADRRTGADAIERTLRETGLAHAIGQAFRPSGG